MQRGNRSHCWTVQRGDRRTASYGAGRQDTEQDSVIWRRTAAHGAGGSHASQPSQKLWHWDQPGLKAAAQQQGLEEAGRRWLLPSEALMYTLDGHERAFGRALLPLVFQPGDGMCSLDVPLPSDKRQPEASSVALNLAASSAGRCCGRRAGIPRQPRVLRMLLGGSTRGLTPVLLPHCPFSS